MLGIFDLLVILLTIALGIWWVTVLQWWVAIIVSVASGLILAPLITSRLQPFSVVLSCGFALITVNLIAWI